MTASGPTARPARRRTLWLALLATLAVTVIGTGVVVAVRSVDDRCTDGSPLVSVAADPAVAEVLGSAMGPEQRTGSGRCVRVRVAAGDPIDVSRDIGAGRAPQLWVPDSAATVQLAVADRQSTAAGPRAEVGTGLARSPLVAAAPAATAQAQGWTQSPGWAALLDGQPAMADPTATGDGLLTLLAVRAVLGATPEGAGDLTSALVRLGRSAVPDAAAALDEAPPGAVFTTEQSVLARAAGGATPDLTVAYPAEGTLSMDYPVVRLRSRAEPPGTDEAVAAAGAALRSPRVALALRAAGFRDPLGALGVPAEQSAAVGVRAEPPAELPAPSADQVDEVLGLWEAATLPSRLLGVFDVSGSMAADAGGGRTGIELARDAALAGLVLFPEESAIGAWAFSTEVSPDQDWRELVPIGPLSAPVGAGTRRAALQAATASLPDLVGGGSPLYDTVLAARRAVQRDYQPGPVNSVALFSDGVDRDDVEGIDLPTLLETLRAETDPARPVPVFMIGIGADVGLAELTAIAEATGGHAYQASTPAAINRVLLDALAQRACRPRC